MELLNIAREIEEKISQLESLRKKLPEIAEEKAAALAEYDKELAKVIIQLRNGKDLSLDGEKIDNPPTTIIEKIAKGICHEHRLRADLAETRYKNLNSVIDIIKSQLNGWQSINRNLQEM